MNERPARHSGCAVEAGAGALRRTRSAASNCRLRSGPFFDQPEPETLFELTVIIPARNEEDCIGACLESLVRQSDDIFELGRDWELIVVDDDSTDRTAEIARGFSGVTVLKAAKLEKGWTGKANAIWTAARKARGNGCSSPTPTPFTSRATCTAACTRPRATRQAC